MKQNAKLRKQKETLKKVPKILSKELDKLNKILSKELDKLNKILSKEQNKLKEMLIKKFNKESNKLAIWLKMPSKKFHKDGKILSKVHKMYMILLLLK